MNKVRVVFLGSRPLGLEAVKILESIEEVDIIGCITKELPATAWWSTDPHEYCKGKYNQLELSDLDNLNFDFGVSINYWKLIPGNIIKKPVLGFVNLHHSYNLSYRGRDMNTYAIRDARNLNRWFHGTCLHYTDDGLDTGPIINSRACSINDFDTAWSLFNKVESLGRDILQEWLPRLVVAKAPISFPEDGHPMSNRKDIGKEIKLAQKDKIEIYDFVRSLDFNNHYEPAYYIHDDTKIYLTTSTKFGGKILLDAGNNRLVYENIKYKI